MEFAGKEKPHVDPVLYADLFHRSIFVVPLHPLDTGASLRTADGILGIYCLHGPFRSALLYRAGGKLQKNGNGDRLPGDASAADRADRSFDLSGRLGNAAFMDG